MYYVKSNISRCYRRTNNRLKISRGEDISSITELYRMLLKDKTTKSRVTGDCEFQGEGSRLAPAALTYSSLYGNKHRRSGVTRSPLTSGTFVFCFQRAHRGRIVVLLVHAVEHISFAIANPRIKSTKKFQSNQSRWLQPFRASIRLTHKVAVIIT